jgi:hypothetical protein
MPAGTWLDYCGVLSLLHETAERPRRPCCLRMESPCQFLPAGSQLARSYLASAIGSHGWYVAPGDGCRDPAAQRTGSSRENRSEKSAWGYLEAENERRARLA